MNKTEMIRWLRERDLRLTKSLGQNFLHDASMAGRIARAAEIAAGDPVLEVGPGLGPLTERLLAEGAEVTAVEIDRRLADVLDERFAHCERFVLVRADILKYLAAREGGWESWRVVSNLPYSVGSRVLVDLCFRPDGPKRLTVTLQKEVVDRLRAAPGGKDYGALSLLAQLNYAPGAAFGVPPSCFFPAPDVESACVSLVRKAAPLLAPETWPLFRRLVKRGFSQRRKMMLKLLKQDWPAAWLADAFAAAGVAETARAEKVGLPEFIAVAERLAAIQKAAPESRSA